MKDKKPKEVDFTDFLALCIATYQLLLPVVGLLFASMIGLYLLFRVFAWVFG